MLLAQQGRSLAELTEDPVLLVAAIMLIAVSVIWIVMSRLITREMKRTALRQLRAQGKKPPRPAKDSDIWSYPP